MSTEHETLKGRRVLITGAGRGLGAAIAKQLADQGAAVLLHYRNSGKQAQALMEKINEQGGQAACVQGDLADPTTCQALVDEVEQSMGGLDSLVLNAGTSRGGPLLAADIKGIRETIETNLIAAMQLTALCLPLMLQNRFGRIVALGSIAGVQGGLNGQCAYAASKGGLTAFIKTLANEMSPRADITANLVSPGVIPTDMSAHAIDAMGETMASHVPLQRFGQPNDVASAVAFLLSTQASYINGHNLVVDGGYSLGYIPRPGKRFRAREPVQPTKQPTER